MTPQEDPTLRAVAALLAPVHAPWAFCGGWALDLWLGRQTRAHGDVDVALLRADHVPVLRHLRALGWSVDVARAGALDPWDGAPIAQPAHGVWCRHDAPGHGAPPLVEFLLNESEGDAFVYRRDPSVRLPLASAFIQVGAWRVLAPELVLLYKSKRPDTPRHAQDFAQAAPQLDAARRAWLRAALGPAHPWAGALTVASE